MPNWIENARKNIIPLSKNKTLKEALKEWIYTGNVVDLEEATEVCQLCEHPNIRYQFEIYNEGTSNELLVGSECIKKFGLQALSESGVLLNKVESKKLVDRDRRTIENQARVKRVVNSIFLLSEMEKAIDFETFIGYLDEHGAFTPKQLNLLMWKLDENKIEHRKSDYKMKMRRNREKDQLIEMKKFQLRNIWPCMTSQQKKRYIELITED